MALSVVARGSAASASPSLFIAIAFEGTALLDSAKVGILAGSLPQASRRGRASERGPLTRVATAARVIRPVGDGRAGVQSGTSKSLPAASGRHGRGSAQLVNEAREETGMTPSIFYWFNWDRADAFSIWMRESTSVLAFPNILFLHTLAMGSSGTNAAVDLRVLGFAPEMRSRADGEILPLMVVVVLGHARDGTQCSCLRTTTGVYEPVW